MIFRNESVESYQRVRSEVEDRVLERVMLEHLAAVSPHDLPGCEGMRICDILNEYSNLSDSGIVPPKNELPLRYPELTAAVIRYFD